MIKIIDNVDLKELLKFGFEYDTWEKRWTQEIFHQGQDIDLTLQLLIDDRIIGFVIDGVNDKFAITNLTIIFDLIQAGIVEKVEEK